MSEQPNTDWTYLETENEYCLAEPSGRIVVRECFLKGKHAAETNEDGIFVDSRFVAVIDGATSKSAFYPEGKTTGRLAMELVKKELENLPADATMPQAVQAITARISSYYIDNGLTHTVEAFPARRLTASAVIYSQYRHEVWQIGDCLCRIGDIYSTNGKAIDKVMAEARAAFNEVALLGGTTWDEIARNDPGRDFIRPFLERQAALQNNRQAPASWSFTVFDGFPPLLGLIKVFPVAVGREVILASDGYPRLCASLRDSETSLHNVLTHDPNCMRMYKATKGLKPGNASFDDRAYIRFLVKE